MSLKQNTKSLKKKSSSLGVELQPLVLDDATSVSYYGSPDDGEEGRERTSTITQKEASEKEAVNEDSVATLPRATQLMRPESLAIPACYLCVGLMQVRVSSYLTVVRLVWFHLFHSRSTNFIILGTFKAVVECLSS